MWPGGKRVQSSERKALDARRQLRGAATGEHGRFEASGCLSSAIHSLNSAAATSAPRCLSSREPRILIRNGVQHGFARALD
eukprot:4051222-Pleurochrysis_carterae.AAC.2